MLGSIAAELCSSGSTSFDVTLPVRPQDNCFLINGWCNWFSKHLEVTELVELLGFSLLPFVPGDQFLELPTSEEAWSLFFGCCGRGSNGIDGEFK